MFNKHARIATILEPIHHPKTLTGSGPLAQGIRTTRTRASEETTSLTREGRSRAADDVGAAKAGASSAGTAQRDAGARLNLTGSGIRARKL